VALRRFLALSFLGSAYVEVEDIAFGVVVGMVEDQRSDLDV
jgi:hypothetical protein